MPGPAAIAASSWPGIRCKRTKVWAIHENFPVWSGTLVTAGDVAFYGTMDRWFKAVDAKTGKVLWQFHAGSGIIGQPVTYKGRDGTQYVAILSGVGGWPGAIANAELDPRVRNGALGFAGAMQDLPAYTAGGSTLWCSLAQDRGRRAGAMRSGGSSALAGSAQLAGLLLGLLASRLAPSRPRRRRRARSRGASFRVCADPNNLPFSNDQARASRTSSPS